MPGRWVAAVFLALACMPSHAHIQIPFPIRNPDSGAGNKVLKLNSGSDLSAATDSGPLRLRGGMFGLGQKQEPELRGGEGEGGPPPLDPSLVDNSKRDPGRFMRTASYSVLDKARITEHHVGQATPPDNLNEVMSPIPKAVNRQDSQIFAQKAREQATTQRDHKSDQDRVAAALEAVEAENKEQKRLNVVLISSELARYAKTGGLADVADKLSLALAKRGHRVMTVVPMYGHYDGVVPTGVKRCFGLWGGGHEVEYWHKWEPAGTDANGNETGVDRVFVDNPCYHRPGMYGEWGQDYGDNLFRFALFAWAGLEAPLCVPAIAPFGEDTVFVANDWQTGLVPLIMTSHYRRYRCFGNARVIFVVHNMGYHGVYPNPPRWEVPKFSFLDFGLRDNSYYDRYVWTFPVHERPSQGRDPRDDGEAIKLLRGGMEMADRVVTVAPSYKDEIMSLEGGFGMHDTARAREYHLDGILNGIDIDEWDPSKDPHISHPYSAANMTNKTGCKQTLQFLLGLEQKPDTPIVAFIGRLAPQKGVDLIEQILGWLLAGDHLGVTGDVQLVMMGSGDGHYCEFLKNAEAYNKGRVVGYVGFTPEMEHKIIAGADILIMPSKYEPCGLPQMYAQRYGTVPVVHATGGLKDSVIQYDPFADAPVEDEEEEEGEGAEKGEEEGAGEGVEKKKEKKKEEKTEEELSVEGHGTGWQFDSADAEGLKFGVWNALHTYKHYKDSWKKMMKRCMTTDFSWELSAKKYEQIFEWARMDPPSQNPWPF